METMTTEPLDGERYAVGIRGHRVVVDQPVPLGGSDSAPTPTELFVAGLTSCVAYYAGRYVTRHGHDRAGLRVTADWEMATDRPARVASVRLSITPPAGLPPQRWPGLLAVASHCTVHNSLQHTPEVAIDLATASAGTA
jgi:putative redox protein